jgi:hypothetical protein
MEFSTEIEMRLSLYQNATEHDRVTAITRLLTIALAAWETDPYYMPERVCGRVRPTRVSP